MDNETQKIIDEQIKLLPADVRASILSVDYKIKLQEITKRQRLLIDQAAKLEMETTLVMIGLEPLADYIGNIQRELGISIIKAREIALDVSENIFKPIRESLEKMDKDMSVSEETPNSAGENTGEESAVKFTNSNETNLNRDQILNEIENPATINGGDRVINFISPNSSEKINTPVETKTTEMEIRPVQELETLPGQEVKDIKEANVNILEAKMTGPTIITQQEVISKTSKLPEPEKKKPSSGIDPYREAII